MIDKVLESGALLLNAVLVATATGLAAVIDSDSINAWTKMTSIPVLGGVVMALLWFNWKMLTRAMDSHENVMKSVSDAHEKVSHGIITKIDLVRADHQELLEKQAERQTEMMREILKEHGK